MEKLHKQLLALPARRVAADTKKHTWWAFGAALVVVIGPILILSLLPLGTLVAVGAFLGACALAAACWFVGVLRGMVVVPTLDDDAIEEKTRKRARETLKVSICFKNRKCSPNSIRHISWERENNVAVPQPLPNRRL